LIVGKLTPQCADGKIVYTNLGRVVAQLDRFIGGLIHDRSAIYNID
jgi:hypothetical protein